MSDVLTLQVSTAAQLVVQGVATVVLALVLGAREQGAFVAAVTLQAVTWSLLSAGLGQGVAGHVAAAAAGGRAQRLADWLAHVTLAGVVLGGLALAAGWTLLPPAARVWLGDEELGRQAAWLSFLPLIELPRTVAAVALQGTRSMTQLARLEAGQALVRAFLVAAGALGTGSASGAVAGLLAGGLVASCLALGLYGEARRETRTGGAELLPSVGRIVARAPALPLLRGLRLGLRISLLKNAHFLFCHWLPRLALASLSGLEWVAYYHVAERILALPSAATQAFSRVLLPALGEHAGRRDPAAFVRLFRRATLSSGAAMLVALALTLALTPSLCAWLLPPDYGPPVLHLALILSLSSLSLALGAGVDAYHVATNRVREWVLLSLLGILVMVPLDLWLIHAVPVTGPAWGAVVVTSWMLVLVGNALRRTPAEHAW